MNRPDATEVLNRLFQILHRSLPVYLQHARPWSRRTTEKALDVLANLAADQESYAELVADAIHRRGGRIAHSWFPMEFLSTNDLSLAFLVRKVTELHRRDVDALAECAGALPADPELRALADEVLGSARGHLDALEDLLAGEAVAGKSAPDGP